MIRQHDSTARIFLDGPNHGLRMAPGSGATWVDVVIPDSLTAIPSGEEVPTSMPTLRQVRYDAQEVALPGDEVVYVVPVWALVGATPDAIMHAFHALVAETLGAQTFAREENP